MLKSTGISTISFRFFFSLMSLSYNIFSLLLNKSPIFNLLPLYLFSITKILHCIKSILLVSGFLSPILKRWFKLSILMITFPLLQLPLLRKNLFISYNPSSISIALNSLQSLSENLNSHIAGSLKKKSKNLCMVLKSTSKGVGK